MEWMDDGWMDGLDGWMGMDGFDGWMDGWDE